MSCNERNSASLYPKSVLLLGVALLFALGAGGVYAAKSALGYVSNQVIVTIQPKHTASTKVLARQLGGSVAKELASLHTSVINLPHEIEPKEAAELLKKFPEVRYAEPNYLRHALTVPVLDAPDDPAYNDFDYYYAPYNISPTWYQWNLHKIQALEGWSIWPGLYYTAGTKPSNAIKAAVIDTGIDPGHADFINAGGSSTDAAYGGQIDIADSANMITGYVGSYPGIEDEFGHGTHVAGILAAATNNGFSYELDGGGIAGIGYNAQIMSLKILDASGSGSVVDEAQAIVYAADHGAKVINLSLGSDSYSQLEQDAVNYAWSKGVLIVAAAGNDSSGTRLSYPAGDDRVLAVSATSAGDTLASYSNWGKCVGIAAPGGDTSYSPQALGVWSSTPTYLVTLNHYGYYNYYDYLEGTSMATPHVAGLAALYAGYRRALTGIDATPWEIYQAIQQGADNIAPTSNGGWESKFGYGRINVYSTMAEINSRNATVGGICGQVLYKNAPLKNCTVRATGGTGTTYSAVSRADGNYRLANLPPGSYTLTASLSGNTITLANVTVTAGCDLPGVDLSLSPLTASGAIAGRVVNATSGAAVKAQLTVRSASNRIVARATSNLRSGDYTITKLSPGTYSLQISTKGYITQKITGVQVVAGETTWVDVSLQRSSSRH